MYNLYVCNIRAHYINNYDYYDYYYSSSSVLFFYYTVN